MSASWRGLACVPFVFWFTPASIASQVVVTITGTVAPGSSDTSGLGTEGLFDAPRTDLTGRSFTLTFTFDDTKGTVTNSFCCGPPPVLTKSDFLSQNPDATGNVVLQIGSVSYAFPPPSGPHSPEAYRTGGAILSSAYFFSSVQDQVNDSDVVALVYPAPGDILTPTVDWATPFTYTNLTGQGMYAAHVRVKTSDGDLAADVRLNASRITVGATTAAQACALVQWPAGIDNEKAPAADCRLLPAPDGLLRYDAVRGAQEGGRKTRARHRAERDFQDVPGGARLGARRPGTEDEQPPVERGSRRAAGDGGGVVGHVHFGGPQPGAQLYLFDRRIAGQFA
jgi:hypothetical protein